MSSSIVCAGCGWTAPPLEPRPFRCPHAGSDDADHVLARHVTGVAAAPFFDRESNPFARFRTFTHAWHTAIALGMTDEEFLSLIRIDFRQTPLRRHDGWWVKDETRNVAGSHKSRHLMGLMLWLLVAERIDPSIRSARLAIASCGNAALAAATVASAYGRSLDVYVPDDASPAVLARIEALGAAVTRCARRPGELGDPAYLRFREAVAGGALPFTCQGNENGLVIEGGETLGWELAAQLSAQNVTLGDLFIQVGGGALASALIAGLAEAHALGVIPRLPRIHAVQTLASPLRRAWERLDGRSIDYAIAHRSEFMWPLETAPHSIATGILDDETYDWAAVLRGVAATGGSVITVTEDHLREANRIAGKGVSPTGSAGLAGAIAVRARGECGVLFTG